MEMDIIPLNIVTFEVPSPIFEMQRSGDMPFTVQKWNPDNPQTRLIAEHYQMDIILEIVNPETKETFKRRLFKLRFHYTRKVDNTWMILDFEDEPKEKPTESVTNTELEYASV